MGRTIGGDGRHILRRAAVFHGLIGLSLGYVVIHFATALMNGVFRFDSATLPFHQGLWESSTLGLIPLGVAFALLGLLVGAAVGYGRAMARFQTNHLVETRQVVRGKQRDLEEVVADLRAKRQDLRRIGLSKCRSNTVMLYQLEARLAGTLACANVLLNRKTERWGPRDTKLATEVQRQAGLMTESLRYVKELEQLESGKGLQLLSADVHALLHEIQKDLSFPGASEVISVGDRHLECPKIAVDPGLIVNVLSYITLNAISHNPAGGTVVLDAEYDRQNPCQVVFTCRDSGDGIPHDHRWPVFEQIRGAHIEGTSVLPGLGQAFCRAAAETLGGRIWFVAEEGVGTTVHFSVAAKP